MQQSCCIAHTGSDWHTVESPRLCYESMSLLGCVAGTSKVVACNAVLPMLMKVLHGQDQEQNVLKLQGQVSL